MHLLVVDDNSPDGTGKIVEKAAKKNKKIHLLTGEKAGLGMAYVRGMKYALEKLKADAVIEMDADFQHDPKYIKPMVDAYLDGADYVIGSRYIVGGSIPKGWEWYRKAVSYFGNLFARTVLWLPNLHDITTGFRLTDAKLLKKISLEDLMELNHFAYKIDLFYQSVGLAKTPVEVPIHFAERKKEVSKFKMQEMIASYKVVVLLRLRKSQRFLKYAAVGFLGYSINAIGIEIFRRMPVTENLADYFFYLNSVPVLNIFSEASSWAAALAAEVSIISNFILNNSWTFSDKKISSPMQVVLKFLQFNLTSIGAVVIQFVVIGAAALILGDTAVVRQIALIFAVGFLIIPYNYVVYNMFIWKTWKIPGFLSSKKTSKLA